MSALPLADLVLLEKFDEVKEGDLVMVPHVVIEGPDNKSVICMIIVAMAVENGAGRPESGLKVTGLRCFHPVGDVILPLITKNYDGDVHRFAIYDWSPASHILFRNPLSIGQDCLIGVEKIAVALEQMPVFQLYSILIRRVFSSVRI